MKVFIVNQNPNSIYDDVEGERYQYPKKIPCGRQIDVGDFLVFNVSKKAAIKLGLANKRITGIARISEIIDYKQNEKEMGFAVYEWYKKFPTPLTFDQIGGDYRTNINNSMNKVDEDKKFLLISSLLKYL